MAAATSRWRLSQIEVYRFASFVDRPVQVHPATLHLDIGFVATPGTTHGPGVALPALLQLRSIVLHPPQNGGMGQPDTPLTHHADQITIAQLETQIPTDAQNDNLPVKVPPPEQLLNRYETWHLSMIANLAGFCTRASAWRWPVSLTTAASNGGR